MIPLWMALFISMVLLMGYTDAVQRRSEGLAALCLLLFVGVTLLTLEWR